MAYDIYNSDTEERDVLPFGKSFTEEDALRGMFEIAAETGQELLEDPDPLNAGLLRKTIEIMTSEVSPETIESLGLPRRKEWNLLSSFAKGKPTPVDRIIDACLALLPLVAPDL